MAVERIALALSLALLGSGAMAQEDGLPPLGAPADPVAAPAPDGLPPAAPVAMAGPGGATLRFFGALGASVGDEKWRGPGGSLALDLWDPETGRAVRWSLEGGAYGGAAAVGVVVPFGDLPFRPYLAGTIGLGAFGGVPGIPFGAAAGLELVAAPFSIAVEARGTVGGYEDADGVSHGFVGASVVGGIGVTW